LVSVLERKTVIYISSAVQDSYIRPKTRLRWRFSSFVQVPRQKPKAVEHDGAEEAVKVEDRHLARKEEGIPDSLEWCVFLFFFFLKSSIGRCWAGIPVKGRGQDSLNWPGCRALPQPLTQENLLSQVQADPGRNAE